MTDLPPQTVIVEAEGLTVPLIVWRKFRGPRPGLVERTFALNPGLASLGPRLPVGTVFLLPINREEVVSPVKVVSLWD